MTATQSSSTPTQSLEVYLAERPVAAITPTTFATRYVAIPTSNTLPAGTVLVRVLYASADPAMRGWLSTRRSYVPPVAIGAVMRAMFLGVVHAVPPSGRRSLVGELVVGLFGWRQFATREVAKLKFVRRVVPRGVKATAALGVLGATGLTAFFGLIRVGRVQRGDVVVVSAAAGTTGSVAVQLARVEGCSVIGIAGGEAKCAYVRDELQ